MMKKHIQRFAVVMWFCLIAIFAGVGYRLSAYAAEPVAPPGEIGSQLPTFTVQDMEGRTISSAAFKGKVVLIDFWATWCQPCKKEMPGYQKLANQYGAKGFRVIGFKADMMRDQVDPKLFVKKLGIQYPIAVGAQEVRDKFGGIEGLPTTMIYDRDGILRTKIIGFEYTDVIESAIKPLLEKD